MRKKLKIEIGSDLNIVNGIGFFLIIFGLLVFVVSGIVLLSGILLPLEMKVIYFVEVISKNLYLTFLSSIIVIIVGSKLVSLRKYESTDLEIYDDRIVFNKGKERIELLNEKIYKLILKKDSWNGKKRLNIKTIGIKMFESQMNKTTYLELTDFYSEKLFKK